MNYYKFLIFIWALMLFSFVNIQLAVADKDLNVQEKKQKDSKNEIASLDSLIKYEQKLKLIGDSMIDGSDQFVRSAAVREFIPLLVKTLQLPGSFNYPFDSLKYIFKLLPPDKSFRLYNWTIGFDDGTFRYYGAIQMNSDDFILFPLFDAKETLGDKELNTELDNRSWRGAQYYEIIQTGRRRSPFYTLIGWDGSNPGTQIKLIDVLTFDDEGKPVFGAPIFNVMKVDKYDKDKIEFVTQHRVIFEYSPNAVMTVRKVDGMDVIVFDHLVQIETGNKIKKLQYVPDGTYDYFIFQRGEWTQNQNPFDELRKPIE